MKKTSFVSALITLPALLVLASGCASTQGVVAPTSAPAVAPAAPAAKPIEPAPVSKSYRGKEAFQGAEYVVAPAAPTTASIAAAQYPNARQINLRVGEITQVYQGAVKSADGGPQMSFYLPPEATSVVQLIVEKKGFTRAYFLKALARGQTVGGIVQRNWLDAEGFRAASVTDEARIQSAVKAQPFILIVE